MTSVNLGLVRKLARQYSRTGDGGVLAYEDLYIAGCEGLRRAVSRVGQYYDLSKGQFDTYAYFWIRAGMTREIQNEGAGLIRKPVWFRDTLRAYGNAEERLWQSLGKQPTRFDIAKEMEITPERLDELKANSIKTINFSRFIPSGADEDFDPVEAIDRRSYQYVADKQDSFRPTENNAFKRILHEKIIKRIRTVLRGKENVFDDEEDMCGLLPPEVGLEEKAKRLKIPAAVLKYRRSKARFDIEPVIDEFSKET